MKRYRYAGCGLLLALLLAGCDVVAPGTATPSVGPPTTAPLSETNAPAAPTFTNDTPYPAPATTAPLPAAGPGTPYPPPDLPIVTPTFPPGYVPPTP
jgi:hypothetical protein